MLRNMICVACPVGCRLSVEYEGAEVLSVEGNTCKRGIEYAKTEIINPTRTLTTTARLNGGRLPVIPVKSERPIPKKIMADCMKIINTLSLDAPVKMGQPVIFNILDSGINIITTNCDKGK